MSYNDIRNAREGFVDMGIGDSLIKLESRILGIALFIVMLVYDYGFVNALIAGLACMIVFPILIGLIPFLGWLFGIVFSVGWAVIGYLIGAIITEDNVIVGILVGVVAFIISIFKHKVFSGLGYTTITKHVMDSIDETRDNTAELVEDTFTEEFVFCPNCGTKSEAGNNFCKKCGARL